MRSKSNIRQFATGIQTTGSPHLGNILGAVSPAVEKGRQSELPPVYVVADMFAAVSLRNPLAIKTNIYRTAAAWMAFGAADYGFIFRESQIPELSEIALLLSGVASVPSQSGDLGEDMFSAIYPIMMTADILMLGASHVWAGQDSQSQLSFVRKTGISFNSLFREILTIPESVGEESSLTIPGTDGQKMSKSAHNDIDVLTEPEAIREIVNSIPEMITENGATTDSEISSVAHRLLTILGQSDCGTGLPVGHQSSLNMLSDVLIEEFRSERTEFRRLMGDPQEIRVCLSKGEEHVSRKSKDMLKQMRSAMGLS